MKRILLLFILIASLLLIGNAAAEEILTSRGELLWLGDFPVYEAPVVIQKSDFSIQLAKQLRQQREWIDVRTYHLTPEACTDAYFAAVNEYPDLFYIGGEYRYRTENGYVTEIAPAYLYTPTEIEQRISSYEAGVNAVVEYASTSETTIGKLLLANDYLCMNYKYDEDYDIYSAQEFFEYGEGVCQAYTLAYAAVLDKLGITNARVISRGMNHTWNVVQIDGNWYHIDVTWNDPLPDTPMRALHEFFLLSDDAISSEGNYGTPHYGWGQTVICGSTKYDQYFWRNVYSPLPVHGPYFYYIDRNDAIYSDSMKIIRWSSTSGATEIHDTGVCFNGLGEPALGCNGDRLFYFDENKMYSIDMNGRDQFFETTIISDMCGVFSAVCNPETNQISLGLEMFSSDYSSIINQYVTILAIHPRAIAVTPKQYTLIPGEACTLSVSFEPSYSAVPCTYTSDDPSIARVSQSGAITAGAPGVTTIHVRSSNGCTAECRVIVHYTNALRLPEELTAISDKAFANTQARDIILSDKVSSIGARAFADCSLLRMITIPAGVVTIDPTALQGSEQVIILCQKNSAAHQFANNNQIQYILID